MQFSFDNNLLESATKYSGKKLYLISKLDHFFKKTNVYKKIIYLNNIPNKPKYTNLKMIKSIDFAPIFKKSIEKRILSQLFFTFFPEYFHFLITNSLFSSVDVLADCDGDLLGTEKKTE